jgi:hypothetical protein
MDAKQYNKNLPKILHRTGDELREEKARQDALKPKQVTYDEDSVLFNRAIVDEQTAREALALDKRRDVMEFNRLKLAEAYLEQGRFDEAYKTHPDKRYKQFLKKIRDAGNEKPCGHARFKEYNESRNGTRNIVQIPNFRLWRIVYDGAPSKYISIFVCNICLSVWKEQK